MVFNADCRMIKIFQKKSIKKSFQKRLMIYDSNTSHYRKISNQSLFKSKYNNFHRNDENFMKSRKCLSVILTNAWNSFISYLTTQFSIHSGNNLDEILVHNTNYKYNKNTWEYIRDQVKLDVIESLQVDEFIIILRLLTLKSYLTCCM